MTASKMRQTNKRVSCNSVGLIVAVVRDVEQFRRFHNLITEYEESLAPDLRHAEFEQERTRAREVYSAPNAAFAAELDGGDCGCVAFVRRDASAAIIKKLCVPPRYRERGVARALLTFLIAIAHERGYSTVMLDTDRERLAQAYRLYLALGFTQCAPYDEVSYACPTLELAL